MNPIAKWIVQISIHLIATQANFANKHGTVCLWATHFAVAFENALIFVKFQLKL